MPKWDFHRAEEKALKALERVRSASMDLAAMFVETIEQRGAEALPDTAPECRLILWALESVDQRAAARIVRDKLAVLEANEAAEREREESDIPGLSTPTLGEESA